MLLLLLLFFKYVSNIANKANPLVTSVNLIVDQMVTLDQAKAAIVVSLNYLIKELFIKGKEVPKHSL